MRASARSWWAWVVLRDGAATTDDELRVLPVAGRALQGAADLQGSTDFPMTVTGKVQKFKMREMAIEELGLQSAASITTA